MKSFLIRGLLVSSLALCVACKQNPFPSGLSAAPTRAETSTTAPQIVPVPPAPVLALDAPASVSFQEGMVGLFTVAPRFSSGTPILTVSNLPQGATFDPLTYTLTWTPPMGAGFDPAEPNAYFKEYHVQFQISSSDSPLTAIVRDVDIIVTSRPQRLTIDNGGASMQATEGKQSQFKFTITSPDAPSGPFSFDINPKLDGAVITPSADDPAVYVLDFTPSYSFVTEDDTWGSQGYTKDVSLKVSAAGPRGQKAVKVFTLTAHDVRLAPAVSVQDNLVFSYMAEFSVVMEDLNGERPPTLTVDNPAFGNVKIQSIDNGADPDPVVTPPSEESPKRLAKNARKNPVGIAVIDWLDIPQAEFNKPQQLKIHACSGYRNCTHQTLTMSFVGETHHAPQVDRSRWSDGEIKNTRLGSPLRVPLRITDGDNSLHTPTITISPPEMRGEVRYANGTLTIDPLVAGTRVFQVIAQSSYGLIAKESFTIRVYPKEWGHALILEDATGRDPEAQGSRDLLGDSQLLNPALDPITTDSLVLRDAVFFTTSIFKAIGTNPTWSARALGQAISSSLAGVGKVVISTPLVGSLPVPYLPSDLTLAGRFSNLGSPDPLSTFSIVPSQGSVFAVPRQAAMLGQTLSPESTNPLTFAVKPNGACKVVMSLHSGAADFPVAVECAQASGGKILFLGFELADLQFSSLDSGLGQDWMKKWIAQ